MRGLRIFDEEIKDLSKCEVFVFGSNLEGRHTGGAARTAHRKFGAEWGVGVGPTGQCYAIPTMHGNISKIKPYVDDFIEYARRHPNNRFIVTRIGCGRAGSTDEEVAPLFMAARDLPNVVFHIDWRLILDEDKAFNAFFLGFTPVKEEIPVPEAITEDDLKRYCEEFKYIIGSGVIAPLPQIKIRYVIDRDRFGYVGFGRFFMLENGDLYVWSRDEEFKEAHNQDMVEAIFGDECRYRRKYFHRVIFAGVETPYRDYKGQSIYTGDVLRGWLKGFDGSRPKKFYKRDSMLLALGTLGWNDKDWTAKYACVLDNHCVVPEMCARIKRCGSVFYQLDRQEHPIAVVQRCSQFQDIYGESRLAEKDKELLAKYTPNFDKELWMYHANEILGIEFNTKF